MITRDEPEATFKNEVALALNSARVKRILSGPLGEDPDGRPIFAVLGPAGLLAPAWEYEVGGRNGSQVDSSELFRMLAAAGVPDTQIVLSVYVCGGLIRQFGAPEQKKRYLPDIAAGRKLWSFLVSEKGAGSDVTAISTAAVRCAGGFRLSGEKRYALKCGTSDYALCLAKDVEKADRTHLTLFIVPLNAPGVRISVLPSIADEQFHAVALQNVYVPESDVLGAVGEGLQLVSAAINFERSGLDYYVRASRWLAESEEIARTAGISQAELPALKFRQACGKYLIDTFDHYVSHGRDLTEIGAISKHVNSVFARDAALHLYRTACEDRDERNAARVRTSAWSALREAPGLTISAGASEILLDTIFAIVDAGGDKSLGDLRSCDMQTHEKFYRSLSIDLARLGDARAYLRQMHTSGAFHVCAPRQFGGGDQDIEFQLIASFAAGEAAIVPQYLDAMSVMDILSRANKSAEVIEFSIDLLRHANEIVFSYRPIESLSRTQDVSVGPLAVGGRCISCKRSSNDEIVVRRYEYQAEMAVRPKCSNIWELAAPTSCAEGADELKVYLSEEDLQFCKDRDLARRGAYAAGLTLGAWNSALRRCRGRMIRGTRQADFQVSRHELADTYGSLFAIARFAFSATPKERAFALGRAGPLKDAIRSISSRLIHLHGAAGLLADDHQAVFFGLIHECT